WCATAACARWSSAAGPASSATAGFATSSGPRQRERAEHAGHTRICRLGIEAHRADPCDFGLVNAPRLHVLAQAREQRGPEATVLTAWVGGHRSDPATPIDGMGREAQGDLWVVVGECHEAGAQVDTSCCLGLP